MGETISDSGCDETEVRFLKRPIPSGQIGIAIDKTSYLIPHETSHVRMGPQVMIHVPHT